jgi:hypothetical protein
VSAEVIPAGAVTNGRLSRCRVETWFPRAPTRRALPGRAV